MTTKYASGVNAERRAVNLLRDSNYIAARTAGSKSMFDIFALGNGHIRFIQCKSTSIPFSFRTYSKMFSGISEVYVDTVSDSEELGSVLSFELWIYEKGSGFTNCFTVGAYIGQMTFPENAQVYQVCKETA